VIVVLKFMDSGMLCVLLQSQVSVWDMRNFDKPISFISSIHLCAYLYDFFGNAISSYANCFVLFTRNWRNLL